MVAKGQWPETVFRNVICLVGHLRGPRYREGAHVICGDSPVTGGVRPLALVTMSSCFLLGILIPMTFGMQLRAAGKLGRFSTFLMLSIIAGNNPDWR